MSASLHHEAHLAGSHLLEKHIYALLDKADVQLNGSRPWDMQIHHADTLARIMQQRSLGLGESYMDGWWDCAALDEFFYRLLKAGADQLAKSRTAQALQRSASWLFDHQSLRRAKQVAEQHYDLDNSLFEKMLGTSMAYSCGYWKGASTLDEAQAAKLDLICRKLELKAGMTLLDIGCGWGSLLQHAAQHYGVKGMGVTVSKEQASLAQQRCEGLPVTIVLEDYRQLTGRFERIASVGMFEHVGRRNYDGFIQKCAKLLADDGLLLLHCIGENESSHEHDPWIEKYIFPNGELPSIKQIAQAAESHFVMEDVQNMGPDYDRTLLAWDANFCAHWDTFKSRYDERFYRMWRYYLNSCAGAFRARNTQLWQWVFSKPTQRLHTYHAAR